MTQGHGEWGQDVAANQSDLQVNDVAGKSHIQVVVTQQLKSLKYHPHVSWITRYKNDYSLLAEIAVHLLTMATQSADVERSCKVHKIIHSKSRNRLNNKNVAMLMACYVNLRLLKSLEGGKNIDGHGDLESFLDNAILLDTEPDEVVEVVGEARAGTGTSS